MRNLLYCSLFGCFAVFFVCDVLPAQIPNLENHYTFDEEEDMGVDSSGNGRDAFVDFANWVDDDERGGVIEFEGADSGFAAAEIPELPGDNFTIAFWAYRDEDLAGLGAGGNDGLFQVQLDGEFPSNAPADKVIGGWVQKSDAAAWGRLHQEDQTQVNLSNAFYFMEDNTWTHFAYRGDGAEFHLIVDGDEDLGPISGYDGTLAPHNMLFIGKQGGVESWGGRIDDFRVYSRALTLEEIADVMAGGGGGGGVLGDFNGDGVLDATDIDLLSEAARGPGGAQFDLDNSGSVDGEDRRVWVEDLRNTWFGDANLDGEFNSQDFVAVFQAGEYEDQTAGNSTWATGDWNGDTDFNSSDFVTAFQGGGFERGPRAAVSAVPEPASFSLLGLATACLLFIRRRRLVR